MKPSKEVPQISGPVKGKAEAGMQTERPKAGAETAEPSACREQGAAYRARDWPGGRGLAPSSAPGRRGRFPLGPTNYRDRARNDPCWAVPSS